MPKIHVLPEDKEIEAKPGETLLQATVRTGIPLTSFCGGIARCSTCRVKILQGLNNCSPPTADEQAIASMMHFDPQVRLACQTVATGEVKLRRLVLESEDVDLDSLFIMGVEPCAIGIEKHIFIMFSDIKGFTSYSENLMPYDVIYALNLYFKRVGPIIASHGGRIDSYMGDGFLALFENEDPTAGALQAVTAGLEIIAEVQRLGPELENLYQKAFEIRVGLHYGQVVAGKLGSPGNKKLTVIGDAVNLASRIEAANKQVGSNFLISEDTYKLVKEKVQTNQIVHLNIPGKTGKYSLYEIVGLTG
jgi:adenylate cyclase